MSEKPIILYTIWKCSCGRINCEVDFESNVLSDIFCDECGKSIVIDVEITEGDRGNVRASGNKD